MIYDFDIAASETVLAYCEEIANAMVEKFRIEPDEAVGRINEIWGGRPFWSEELLFHETPQYWAFDIYYGHDSYWWHGAAGLNPVPFPKNHS